MAKKHSHIGASKSDQWMSCPGSIALSAFAPEQQSSIYAEEGTAAHTLGEKALLSGKDADAYIGKIFNRCPIQPEGFEVDEEMADCVQLYLDTVRDVKKYDVHGVETPIHLNWIDNDLFGTSDAHRGRRGRKLTVFDYKHGAGVAVDAEENPQLLYYTLGIAALYDFDFEEYEAVIVQPRAMHGEGPVRRYEFDRKRLKRFERELKDALVKVKAAEQAEDIMEYLATGDHCRWCPAAVNCPKILQETALAVREDFDEVTDDIRIIGPTPPEELTPQKLADALAFANVLEGWITACRSLAYNQALNGTPPPGYKLVAKNGHRKFEDPNEAMLVLKMLGYDDLDIYAPRKLKSPAQVEKLGRGAKEFVREFAFTPESGVALVPETDRRQAVLIPPSDDDFDDVEG